MSIYQAKTREEVLKEIDDAPFISNIKRDLLDAWDAGYHAGQRAIREEARKILEVPEVNSEVKKDKLFY